jgi:rhamnulose-1-phosphate aldolase/alcohol dehydrogenase
MKSLWSDKAAGALSGVDLVVYASRIIGADTRLVVWGGGNSSIKIEGTDHTGKPTRILWIKGSGSDMKSITPKHFTPLRLDELLPLIDRDAMTDEEMVAYQSRSVLEPGAPKPSIETLLHAFLPPEHIYHTHADAICALTDTPDSAKTVREVYDDAVALVSYIRPGFLLSKWVGETYKKKPHLRALILDKHGLITWGKTAKDAYLETIKMVTEAERYLAAKARGRIVLGKQRVKPLPAKERRRVAAAIAPALRGEISRSRRMLLGYEDAPEALEFVGGANTPRLSRIGPFTPDHLMHIKPRPLYVEVDDPKNIPAIRESIRKGLERYRTDYTDYFNRYKSAGVTMLDPNPRVILVPGVGIFTTGKDRRAVRIVRDIYLHTLGVIQASEAAGGFRSISLQEICDFEYWPMENFKLTLLPPEKELSRRVALITGAAGGIGKVVAQRLAEEGAAVILADVDRDKVQKLTEEMNRRFGEENTYPLAMDVSDEEGVEAAYREAALVYGGLDLLVSNAGVARSSPVERLSLKDWNLSMAVNATGHFLVCREAMRLFREQGIGGNIVVMATKNVLAPGKEFGAYSASKAAQTQISRILAIEGADLSVRVNMVNPDGVFLDSGLWTPEVRKDRAKAYNVPVDQVEEFYAKRNLLKAKILPQDVAEAVLFFASDRSSKTTGAILPVDGGVREAFPR